MGEFEGKVAIVTGGTRGLGRAIALGLARGGATVALNYRRDESAAAEALAAVRTFAPRSFLVKADLEDDAEVRAMIRRAAEQAGRIDILISNAAATAFKPMLEVKPHNLARTFNLSIGGFVAAIQEAAGFMGEGGRIVMISGIDSIRAMPGHGVLGAAKAALESLVRNFAFELGPRGITVNGVNFGLIESDSSRTYLGEDFEKVRRLVIARTALRRMPAIEEIAAIALMICAPTASFLTAQTILVDGGLTLFSPLEP